ncbi:hypothetical protein HHK36_027068 [Tetracentron sinense]|uniref:CCHC-type domain-containing protein n=1 Tax=Tetracentron sinense TaxID=13715 RepID=A0A834YHX4_TETSI|nr:hypothetical protein HHK36_027068 [Tetracentron sinense]
MGTDDKLFTLAQVSDHNNSKDCWLVINGKHLSKVKLDIPKVQSVVEIEDELIAEGRNDFQFSILGQFVTDRNLNGRVATKTIIKAWKIKMAVRVQELNNNRFLFKFGGERDVLKVLYNQPWCFDGSLLVIRRWAPEMEVTNVELQRVPFWVQLHDLPPDLLTYKIIKRIASDLGEVDEVDFQQGGHHQGSFIRTRVYINISKPLEGWLPVTWKNSTKITITGIKYERLPTFCYHCGVIGHIERNCEDSQLLSRAVREERLKLRAELKLVRPPLGQAEIQSRIETNLFAQQSMLKEQKEDVIGGRDAVDIQGQGLSNGGRPNEEDDSQYVTVVDDVQSQLGEKRRACLIRTVPASPRCPKPAPKCQVSQAPSPSNLTAIIPDPYPFLLLNFVYFCFYHIFKTGVLEQVYDVTKFLEDHPGGDEVLLQATGKDATDDFEDVGHSDTARAMMDEYYVGEFDTSTIPKTQHTPPKQPQYIYQDKSSEFTVKLLQFLVPLAILGLAVGIYFYTKSA